VVKLHKTIPVVFSSITDPVSAGIVPKGSAPGKKTGTNLTGVSDQWPVALQMEIYAKMLPNAKRWGTIYNPAEPNSVIHIKGMRAAAKKLGLALVEVHVDNSKAVAQAAASLVGKIDAMTITSDNTAVAELTSIVQLCNEKKIPLFAGDVDSVAAGAVAAYGLDYYLVGYSAGKKAGLILKGNKPGDIAWGPVEKFSLVINQKAAALQGVALTTEFLNKADKVIK
jgi:putative ABC transport system substrate-binding protein